MDFSLKGGVEYSEIMAPDGSPEWVHDRAELWNAVEASEKRKDAQLAREIQVGLPKELSREAQVELVRNYVRDSFVKEGMVADFSIHRDNPENPHAHIMLTMREVSESGFGQKNREWNSTDYLLSWRENWAMSVNLELSREGHEQRIDHRSYQEQDIQIEPTSKVGARLEKAENDGRDIVRERAREHLRDRPPERGKDTEGAGDRARRHHPPAGHIYPGRRGTLAEHQDLRRRAVSRVPGQGDGLRRACLGGG